MLEGFVYITEKVNIAVVVATEKQDAKMSYKKIKGYHPSFAFIGRFPVRILILFKELVGR